MNFIKRIALIPLCISTSLIAFDERILVFKSTLQVHKDSSMTVQEDITVRSTENTIKHGIVREFPTQYTDRWGKRYNVGFTVKQVYKDGISVPFQIKDAPNGKRVYIGDPHSLVPSGIYTYTLVYATHSQLGFFDTFDELYWNVTGNGWRLPITQALAFVHLPGVPADKIHIEAYTGLQGAQGKSYIATIAEDGTAVFKTTQPLGLYEGLTIVVTWPKGYITEPSTATQWYHFIRDNLGITLLIVGFILTFLFYLQAYIRTRRVKPTVIPLFEPPHNLSPSQVRYLYRGKYDAIAFASEIVAMAVKGMLEIKYSPGRIFGGTYSLVQKQPKHAPSDDYKMLRHLLFDKNATVEISDKQRTVVHKAAQYLEKGIQSFSYKYIDHNSDTLLAGILLSLGFLFGSFLLQNISYAFFIGLALFALLNVIFYYLLQTFTEEGYKLYAGVEGFKMFLQTTEEDRLKVIGTPPTKTPELFEKYLPYAIALGVEQAWSKKFAPLFVQYKQEGHPYIPVWYIGGPYDAFNPYSFSSGFTNSISSVTHSVLISSAPTRPGSSRGSGGGGSSGGGGGGGGGGGW